jgi:tetratricopeptide (TPR) repeat protein
MEAERMLRILCLLASAVLLGGVPVRVAAQSTAPGEQQLAAGNELLEAGKAAYAAGRFAEALNDFEQAYQRTQRASILYRIGDTADKLGDHERAISGFQQYLEAVPNAKEADFVRSRIAANRQALQHPGAQAPLAAPALSPAAAAHAAEPDPVSTPKAPVDAAPSASKDLKREWWLWAGAGTLAVATIVIVAVVIGSSDNTQQVAPVKGNVGGIVRTLEGP